VDLATEFGKGQASVLAQEVEKAPIDLIKLK
jgi:hypothetical protein